ncbi:SLC35E2B [Symbiodinium natans]|uniref:SLC35E2B protein n=1 Tax=Symbiodinium natans TaxID=878477 RepID=A0A812UDJ3_9DINO|nr:SLC35E2B [Symbiodinium natans]
MRKSACLVSCATHEPTSRLVATPKPVARPADPLEVKEREALADQADASRTDDPAEDAASPEQAEKDSLDGFTHEEISALSQATAKSRAQPFSAISAQALNQLPEVSVPQSQPPSDIFRAMPKQDKTRRPTEKQFQGHFVLSVCCVTGLPRTSRNLLGEEEEVEDNGEVRLCFQEEFRPGRRSSIDTGAVSRGLDAKKGAGRGTLNDVYIAKDSVKRMLGRPNSVQNRSFTSEFVRVIDDLRAASLDEEEPSSSVQFRLGSCQGLWRSFHSFPSVPMLTMRLIGSCSGGSLLKFALHDLKRSAKVAFWYVVSFFGIVLNKTILSPGEQGRVDVGPLALVLVQMLSTVVFGKMREVIGSRGASSTSTAKLDWVKLRKSLLVLGLFRFFVAVMGLISLRYVAASFTETIKASSPFFTVVAAWFLTGEQTPLPVMMTLIPVMLGLISAAAGEHSFTHVGFAAAVLANLAECVQNVFCSQLLQPGPDGARLTSGQLQYYSACASLVVQIPFFAAAFLQGSLVLPVGAVHWTWLFTAGFAYFLQSALAFKIMSCYSPVTLSVMNTAKRALIICFSALYFGNVITDTALCGTVVTLLGSGLYSYLKSTIRAAPSVKAGGKDYKSEESSSKAVAVLTTKASGKTVSSAGKVAQHKAGLDKPFHFWHFLSSFCFGTVSFDNQGALRLQALPVPRLARRDTQHPRTRSPGIPARQQVIQDQATTSCRITSKLPGDLCKFSLAVAGTLAQSCCAHSCCSAAFAASWTCVSWTTAQSGHGSTATCPYASVLAETMANFGLEYRYSGQQEENVWAAVVISALLELPPPRCLLGLRSLARECPRLRLAQHLTEMEWEVIHLQPCSEAPPELKLVEYPHTEVYARQEYLAEHICKVTAGLKAEMGLSTSWQQRIQARYRVISWDKWDATRRFPAPGEPALVIALPFETSLLAIPGFLTKEEIFKLQQAALPGALSYEQPRRQVRNPDGSFTHFNERHKEAWLCNDYDYRDTRRVAPPRVHVGQKLSGKLEETLMRAAEAISSPLNGIMCRWEPPGIHLKDGPHTYATHCGWGHDTVIALMAVGATRVYHIHGIPWYYGRGRREVASVNIPLEEGLLIALGGPLREKWLYAQPRDEELLPERVQFTLQLHADAEVMKGGDQAAAYSWTEDCEGSQELPAKPSLPQHRERDGLMTG